MIGTIVNFRRGKHITSNNQMVVKPEASVSKEDAAKLVGKKVSYNTGKKDMLGEVVSAHGNSGAVRVKFETGMPGQAIGQKVKFS